MMGLGKENHPIGHKQILWFQGSYLSGSRKLSPALMKVNHGLVHVITLGNIVDLHFCMSGTLYAGNILVGVED